MSSRYVVGIDLGTTNCALSYVDTQLSPEEQHPVDLGIPQVISPGLVETRTLLPSYLYLPNPGEIPAGSLQLPWDPECDFAVGEFARSQGRFVPTRLVSSAKSWLCHPGVDRKSPILPWKSEDGARRVSPVEASTIYLNHLKNAWNHQMASIEKDHRLENQEVVLTVPASFDAAARDLTVEAARAAGLENLTLLEEPQAAFYSWIDSHDKKNSWRKEVKVGDLVLICDVGGGTTDLTLIQVGEEKGQLVLTRVAIGDHILLGGDNMDLALAQSVSNKFSQQKIRLDQGQMLMLWHACRAAKEKLFSDPGLESVPVTVLGRSSKLIAGTIKGDLSSDEVKRSLLDGFFPSCSLDEQPKQSIGTGLQEIGLPYASDPAISRHMANFISRQAQSMGKPMTPSCILFNGGVFKAHSLRDRVVSILESWKEDKSGLRILDNHDLDRAVARGAAYFGMVRRGKGVRIRGGTARAYYIGVQTSIPAIPGAAPPIKALCVAPFGMEEGTEANLPKMEFGLSVVYPAEFRFLGSSVRPHDTVGTVVEDWDLEGIEELAPVSTTLDARGQTGSIVPVHLQSRVTDVGTLELWCLSRDEKDRWKLEFNVREKD